MDHTLGPTQAELQTRIAQLEQALAECQRDKERWRNSEARDHLANQGLVGSQRDAV